MSDEFPIYLVIHSTGFWRHGSLWTETPLRDARLSQNLMYFNGILGPVVSLTPRLPPLRLLRGWALAEKLAKVPRPGVQLWPVRTRFFLRTSGLTLLLSLTFVKGTAAARHRWKTSSMFSFSRTRFSHLEGIFLFLPFHKYNSVAAIRRFNPARIRAWWKCYGHLPRFCKMWQKTVNDNYCPFIVCWILENLKLENFKSFLKGRI